LKNVPMRIKNFPISGLPLQNKASQPARNLRLEIEYDGTGYNGWQIQRGKKDKTSKRKAKTIQEVIENTLQKILQERIKLIVSGRTDSGVHAKGQVANFKTNSPITLLRLRKALNGLLPKDISINKIEEVELNFHSRFDAKSKLYRYTILNGSHPCALLSRYVYYFPHPLNIRLMKKEAKALIGRHNFKSFQASDKKNIDSMRTIEKLNIVKEGNLIYIYIIGDGFLYNMARNIAGALIEVGRGRFKEGSLKEIIAAKDRRRAGPLSAAKGLCLLRVEY